jgi:hypothetical protein
VVLAAVVAVLAEPMDETVAVLAAVYEAEKSSMFSAMWIELWASEAVLEGKRAEIQTTIAIEPISRVISTTMMTLSLMRYSSHSSF